VVTLITTHPVIIKILQMECKYLQTLYKPTHTPHTHTHTQDISGRVCVVGYKSYDPQNNYSAYTISTHIQEISNVTSLRSNF